MDTSGFYKLDSGQLLGAPNFVLNKNFELKRETQSSYTYPVDGWYWFADEVGAYIFFGLDMPVIEGADKIDFALTCEDGTVLNV